MKKKICIVGGGPAAMILAAHLDPNKFDVHLFEKNKTLGRKFLVAGKGGFNLTYHCDQASLMQTYTPDTFLQNALDFFNNNDVRSWLDSIGISTYVGSSNRVFPTKGIKPIAVLNAILDQMKKANVQIHTEMHWLGWDDNLDLKFNESESINYDIAIYAVGGASWKKTGSSGQWLDKFSNNNIPTKSFRASNCAFQVHWPDTILDSYEGKPLKNIGISINEKNQSGEIVITKFGIEGNAIYPLSSQIQDSLHLHENATIYIDLKPVFTEEKIYQIIVNSNKLKMSDILFHDLKLSRLHIAILKSNTTKSTFIDAAQVVKKIKKLPIKIIGSAEIDAAISTTGGICLSALNDSYMIKDMPDQYAIGEMVDWDAPTGGYLLQGCFSMGRYLAHILNA